MRTLYRDLIPLLWLLWIAFWAIAGLRTKPTIRSEPVASRLSYMVPLFLGIVLLTVPRGAGPWLLTRLYPSTPLSFWIATALVTAGLCFSIWARAYLAGNWSGYVTLKQDHSLIRTGPYRLVRHPIYTGLLVAVLGSAIATAEWRGVVGFALIALSFLLKLPVEEQFLTAQFGDTYRRYQAEVPALIPRFPVHRGIPPRGHGP